MLRNKRLVVWILVLIVFVEIAFLLFTFESKSSQKENFAKQTEHLSSRQKLEVARNAYFLKYNKNPSNISDLEEFLDVGTILKEIPKKDLEVFFLGQSGSSRAGSIEQDLVANLEYFQKKLLGETKPNIEFATLRDPFRPYDPKPLEGATQTKSPLEMVDLSEVALTAVLETEGALKGFVTLPTGQGFLVGKGDTIGKNGGQIAEVYTNKIVVLETVKDFAGNLTTKTREIFLRGK
ncbi:MAG: pilus assembly protein PilP [Deltaproteobacteria bacterium]|nr:pilus assembly protein PilP [Deltaproteobacteria bacterium]MCX7952831.1 pilus assembly protein PilP [Deltaproteobacteria bacterium]